MPGKSLGTDRTRSSPGTCTTTVALPSIVRLLALRPTPPPPRNNAGPQDLHCAISACYTHTQNCSLIESLSKHRDLYRCEQGGMKCAMTTDYVHHKQGGLYVRIWESVIIMLYVILRCVLQQKHVHACIETLIIYAK